MTRVAIVGAGFSGLGLAIRLRQQGERDFCVFDRGDEVGGTWRENSYPGAACDVPSNLYSFSFAPNPDWSRSFSPQHEIQAYLRDCADRFGIRPHLRLGHEVRSATWDDANARWEIETSGGCHTADVLVSARGPLSQPSIPDLPGLDNFAGTVFHSARWDHGHDLSGERVVIVGTGASAVQIVPRIQPDVGHLVVLQRTPPWILPRHDRALTAIEHQCFRAAPAVQRAVRAAAYWARESYVLAFVGSPRRRRVLARVAVATARRQLSSQVADPDLRQALTPRYELGCKRVLLSSDYYLALCQPNVELVTQPVTRVATHSITTADGIERPVDTIVLGTGFDVTGSTGAWRIRGAGGRLLADAWAERPQAYKSTTVSGFPNLFLMVGPNSGLGHTSIVFVIESQIAYVLDTLATMERRGVTSLDVLPVAQERWCRRVAERSRQTVWTAGGCQSYYLDALGHNVAVWPGTSWRFRSALRRFDPEAYRIEYRGPAASAHPAAAAGVTADDVTADDVTADGGRRDDVTA